MRSYAHIVNPVTAGAARFHQDLTLESMRRAAQRSSLPVALFAAGETGSPPDGFGATRVLTRTVRDLAHFAEPRPLPLIGDVLARLYEASVAEWLVYTNIDIVLGEDFYRAVDAEVAAGAEALVINRRTIEAPAHPVTLDWLSAQAGEPHPGYDCFVWRRGLLEDVSFHGVCIGFPPIGRVLVAALSSQTDAFRLLTDRRLTFHIGDDKRWQSERYLDYWRYNQQQALLVLDGLPRLSSLALALRDEIARQEQL
jgi:hypothetical protein